jgi:tetratricopeptide (TPR) repeat protein
VFASLACAVRAQVYQVGSGASQNSQGQTDRTHSTGESLGWGSNIQNARLGRSAQMALQRGDYALAVDYAQRAVRAAPNDPSLWFLLGYAARLDGKFQVALDAYSHGLRLNPSSLDGQSGLAQVYTSMGQPSEAERLLKQVVTSSPGRKNDLVLLGDLYMRSKDYSGAADMLSRAERIQPDARAELLLALTYQQLKQMDLANRYLELAERRAPDNPDVLRSLAGYDREVGNYSRAIAALKSIHHPKPDVVAELAYTYQLAGKLNDSAELYSQAASAEPRNQTLQLSAAQAEIAAGSIAAAEPFLKRAEELDAGHYRLHAIEGEVAESQQRDRDAVREYTAALAALPANPPEGPLYGIQLHMDLVALDQSLQDRSAAQHQLAIAQSQIDAVDESGPGREQFLRLRSLIKFNANDLDGALADIKQALAISHLNRDDLQLNGNILMKLGRTADAIALYKQILAGDPDNRLALASLGYASRAAGQYAEAEKYFERLAREDPSFYVPYLALGDLYTAQREFAKAQNSYSRGYALDPRNASIVAGGMNAGIEAHQLALAAKWLNRATVSMKEDPGILRETERYLSFEGKYPESAAVGRQAIQVLPHDRDVVVYLGYDLLHLGKYDELLSLASKYWDDLPKEPDIPLLAGYAHKYEGEREQAVHDFTEAINRDPAVVTAYVNRGYMLNDLHHPQAASADFETALQKEPNDGEAHLGLAYADLDLQKPQAALREAQLAERAGGDSLDLHVIRATAYGREDMLSQAAREYRAALQFSPGDGALHFGLGNTSFAERQYDEAIQELKLAVNPAHEEARVYALLAQCYANLHDRNETLRYAGLAEQHLQTASLVSAGDESEKSEILVSTGEALSTLGDEAAAMDRFRMALAIPGSDRVGIRLAIAHGMAQQDHPEDAQRQIALGWMEAEAGDTAPPNGKQFVAAADLLSSMHDYELSESFLQRAKSAGAPDAEVRIGLANNYLALGDTVKAQAELSAVSDPTSSSQNYPYLLAKANMLRQEQNGALALTAFAQAENAAGEDQSAEEGMIETGGDEGMRITPELSVLSDVAIEPIFEDSTVYVLDSKLDASFPVSSSDTALLPPPRSSLQTQWTDAFHLHLGNFPPASGFFQLRNASGLISVPSTNSVVNRDTTDSTFNFALNPTIHIGDNVLTFNSGVQGTIRRDLLDPVDMNQNLFRVFTYMTTSSFFNAVSVNGYALRESGPFVNKTLHSRDLAAAVNFRVGAPWGKTALITGWGVNDQLFLLAHTEDYYTSSYAGIEHRFSDRLNLSAMVEYLRAWRIFGTRWGIAQNLRPAGSIDFIPARNWDVNFSSAYSNTRGFHVYDATQNGFSVSYSRPFRHIFRDNSGPLTLQYPIRFSAGMQEQSFFNFSGNQNRQFRPYVEISIF